MNRISTFIGMGHRALRGFGLGLLLLIQPINGLAESPADAIPQSVEGWWLLDLPPFGISLLLKIWKDEHGRYAATQDNLVLQRERGRKVLPFFCDSRNVWIGFDVGVAGVLQMKLNDKGDKLEGYYKNPELALPLSYVRVQPKDFPPEPLVDYSQSSGGTRDLRGYWRAVVDRDGTAFHYGLKIGRTPDGGLRGTFDAFESGRLDHRLTSLSLTNNQARIANDDLNFRFQGELSADGRILRGQLSDWTEPHDIVFVREREPARAAAIKAHSGDGSLGESVGSWQTQVNRQRSDRWTKIQIGYSDKGSPLAILTVGDMELDKERVPSTAASVSNGTLTLEWKGVGKGFQGQLRDGRLQGIWINGKSRTPVVFDRDNEAEKQ